MSGNNENLKTWIMIKEGPTVKNHKIEGITLAQLLIEIQRAYDNIGQSRKLGDIRDFLLPKLMNGEIIIGGKNAAII